jgi:phosphatidylethanolamine-binding protein (PEBP) family uncharacterized protein
MASRPSDQRFLAVSANSASARLCLALAAAAILVAGCGGSSDSAATTSSTDASAAQAKAPKAPTGDGEGSQQSAGESSRSAAAPGSASSASAPSQDAGPSRAKHGPHIAQPKGAPEQAPTAATLANATVADMTLQSPAIAASSAGPGSIPAPYTCDGKGTWPSLEWSGVPAGTRELILYVMNVAPVAGKLFVDWAVAGLKPDLTQISSGELPPGAIVGSNSFGKRAYEICPEGQGEIYMFAIYALPRRLSPPKGFDARELRKQILDVSGNVGLLPAAYAHG